MTNPTLFASLITVISFLVVAAAQEGGEKQKDADRSAMPIYVTPFYDSKGLKVSVGDNSKKLASADARSILEVSKELNKDKDKLRAETMYIAAVRLYDLGHKSVFVN
jgi:hypothetical protein